MSFYNNQSNNYVNSNLPFESRTFFENGAHNSYPNYQYEQSERRDQLDVRFSTLEPTAQEFHPSNQSTTVNNGAVRKNTQQSYGRFRDNGRGRNSRYGSGRTFNSSKSDYNIKNSRTTEDTVSVPDNFSSKENFDDKPSGSTSHAEPGIENKTSDNHHMKSFKRDFSRYDRNVEDYKYDEHSEMAYSQSRSTSHTENQHSYGSPTRTFKWNGRSVENRPNSYNKPEKGKFYDKTKRGGNNYYEKYGRNNAYDKPDRSNNYGERKNTYDTFYRNSGQYAKSDRPKSDVVENRSNDYELTESGNSNSFKNFRPFIENNKQNERKFAKDWRKPNNKERNSEDRTTKLNKKLDAASQRERLEEMLSRRLLECLVCCEKIKNSDKIWSCKLCYHILHLNCVAAWAKSSKLENGWRCPACQNVCSEVPKQYKCYCGKTVEPRYDPGTIPHGCGEMCLKKGRTCDHKCSILCHPGPCPDCTIMVAKSCGCGATNPVVKCSTDIDIVCDSICNKMLECGVHKCKSICHSGSCSPCEQTIIQECYCGKVGRKVTCRAEHKGKTQYACEDVCDKELSCGNHKCKRLCHEGPCEPCARDIDRVKNCPCGRTPLEKPRKTCLDPIPCCDKVCGKPLLCGQPSSPHFCKEYCHEGECPPCPLTTTVRCRCGYMDKELPCQKLTSKADDARCEKKCTKKRLCGKHKCNQRCCIEIEHVCPLPCNHLLSCGQHRCELTCHSGRCRACVETSFEELYCECGASVIFPPVPCGTKPPSCSAPCSRRRDCGHDNNHWCHTGPCAPCTVLCKRWCYGRHEQRSAIPCYQMNFSCGLACGKDMPCGRHKCNKPCHDGPCPLPCKQPCTVQRGLCGHPCGRPCHEPPCQDSTCKQNVPVTCLCGLQKSTRPCLEVVDEFRNIQMAQLKDKMGALSKDQTVDISDLVGKPKKPSVLKILECTEECRVLERNRRLAIGLQIRNPDLSQKLTPKYTDFMRQWAKKDPFFCQRVHDKLSELVQLAKQSKQKSRSFSFESMNRDKRHFIHEYCEHFGIESAAYDMEPNRNIVATAIKDKSWLPSMSLLEVIQRENGQRKVPGPVSVLSKSTPSKPEILSLKLPNRAHRPPSPSGEYVDYFDAPP